MNKQSKPTDTVASMERTHAYKHQEPTEHARPETGKAAHTYRKGSAVKLVPLGPPGRITRKARDFEANIVQLRAQGYTLDAIRQALEAAGVQVSISTVRRESLRGGRTRPAPQATSAKWVADPPAASSEAAVPVAATARAVDNAVPPTWPKGREFAEAYTRDHITNSLSRAKEKR